MPTGCFPSAYHKATLVKIAAHRSLPHSSVSAVNLPMSDGIDVNRLNCKPLSMKQSQRAIAIWPGALASSQHTQRSQLANVGRYHSCQCGPIQRPGTLAFHVSQLLPFCVNAIHERHSVTQATQTPRRRTTRIHRKPSTSRRRAPYTCAHSEREREALVCRTDRSRRTPPSARRVDRAATQIVVLVPTASSLPTRQARALAETARFAFLYFFFFEPQSRVPTITQCRYRNIQNRIQKTAKEKTIT